ncbi:2-oxoglutarate-dependent dioxygenase [Oleiagrimonas sp. C23AA]|nr:2-oxoglutarate-dependent dioxygenase [Oleiagrimonas sp. C23AA]
MTPQVAITPELRDWILGSARSGVDIAGMLHLMRNAGYAEGQAKRILSKVLDRPGLGMDLSFKGASGARTKHPTPPFVEVDGRQVNVSVAVETPIIRVLDNLLSDEECDALIEQSRPRMQRALTLDAEGRQQLDPRRTNNGMFFNLGETELLERIEQRIAELVELPVSHGEGMQILNYQRHQQYEPHWDWFDPKQQGFSQVTAHGGQRVASIIMYLNTPTRGGGTHFPHVDLTVTARRGSAVYFAYEGGDKPSLHAGLPVLEGEKWIATKWLRERPYI